MPATASLTLYLAFLRSGEIVPQPAGEIWSAMMNRITEFGRCAEIDEDTYDYFLDVLPPKWQGRGFAFAEGNEPLRYFFRLDERYFVRQLTWHETETFCQAAGIPFPH